jgi:gliding motility-associated protein GldM
MAGAKETPRQKMIGMMYLVLTAMLALNVSVEILKSFIIVNEAMHEANQNFRRKAESSFALFQKAYLNNPDKLGEAWNKAIYIRDISDSVYNIVHNYKTGLVAFCENTPKDTVQAMFERDVPITNIINRQDNYDGPTLYFMGQSQTGATGRANDLYKTLEWYNNELIRILGPDTSKVSIDLGIHGKFKNANGENVRWEAQYFQHTIIVACLTILNKIQSSILNAENDVVMQLYSSTSDDDFKFDKIEARVLPRSTYVLQGTDYEAEIFVAGFDSKSKVSVTIDGRTIQGDSGRVLYKKPATDPGEYTIQGKILVPTNFGTEEHPFQASYTVAEPMATVSADKMNVFYIGVDNPISAMGGGLTDATTDVRISNGVIKKVSAGKYDVRVSSGRTAVISVYQTAKDGSSKLMGSKEFRIKRVPDPIAKINGQKEGVRNLDKNILANADGLVAELKDFDFDLRVRISSFKLQVTRSGELSASVSSNGNRFTNDMINQIKRCKKGDKVWISEITAQMPDGKRELGDIIINIL